MITSALHEDVKPAIDLYCFQVGGDLVGDVLSSSDWANLSNIYGFLRDFYKATKAIEGCSATLERVLPSMDYLLEKLEDGKTTYALDSFMIPCINSS